MQHFSNVCACQLRKTLGELFSSSIKREQKNSQSLAGCYWDGMLFWMLLGWDVTNGMLF